MRVHERFRPWATEPRNRFRRRENDEEQHFQRRRSQGRFREREDEDYYEEEDHRRQHHDRHERWNGGAQEDFRGDERGYERTARGFYTNDPPSANSAVVETVFRKPKVFADLNEYDDGAFVIDRVPTAIGYHSMDSAEEYNEEKSRVSRYSYDVRDDFDDVAEEEMPPPIQKVPSPDPDDGDKYAQYLQEEPEYQASTMRSMWSDDSDSCPPVWRSFSEEKAEDNAEWALEQAKRRAALNAVNPPMKQHSRGRATPNQRTTQDPADDRSNRERQPSEKEDGGSVRGSMRGSMRDKFRGSQEDSTMADGNENENVPRTSNVQKKQRKSVSNKKSGKRWEAWGYMFNGGGSVKSKKSNDSSQGSRSKSTKSKNSKARGSKHTRGPGSQKIPSQAAKRVPPSDEEAKPAGDLDTSGRRVQKNQQQSVKKIKSSQSVKKTPSSEAKLENDCNTTGRSMPKIQTRPVRKSRSSEAKLPNEPDPTTPQQVQEGNEEKSRRTIETGEKSGSTTKNSILDNSQSQVSSNVRHHSEKGMSEAPIEARTPNPKQEEPSSHNVQQGSRSTRDPVAAPPVPAILSLPVKAPQKQVNPVDNDEFIMQVRGEEDDKKSLPSSSAMHQTEPKQPNTFDGFASMLMNGFAGLSNLGLNEPLSFLDWSGEEKEIEKLSKVASSDSKKKRMAKQTDDDGVISLSRPKNIIRQSESFTLDGSDPLPSKKVESVKDRHSQSSSSDRRSVDSRIREENNADVYEERRSGRGSRDSRSGDLSSNRSEREDRGSRSENNSVPKSRSGTERTSQHLRQMRDDQAQPVRSGSGSRNSKEKESGDVQLVMNHLDVQKGKPELRIHEETAGVVVREQRESQSGKDAISISTIEFPTPELTMHEEDDGSISILGLDRNRTHSRPSNVLIGSAGHANFDEEREIDARAEARSRVSVSESKKSKKPAANTKKGKSTFLGKFRARKKGQQE